MTTKRPGQFSNGCISVLSAVGCIFKSPIVISWILTVAGLITLTAMSVPKLRATRIAAADVHVIFDSPPNWLDDSLLVELQNVARIHLAKATIGREGLIQTASALEATGWFSKVTQVRWVSDNQAEIEAVFYAPYVRIRDNEGVTFVDSQARKLPDRDGSIVKPTFHFITLEQPIHSRPQRPGLQWNGGDVLAGLQLVKLIYDKEWATQVQSINLVMWASDGSMTLVTDSPSQLIWGSAPGEEHGLEALAAEKIDRLNRLFTKFGRIDRGEVAEFDLTDTNQIIRN